MLVLLPTWKVIQGYPATLWRFCQTLGTNDMPLRSCVQQIKPYPHQGIMKHFCISLSVIRLHITRRHWTADHFIMDQHLGFMGVPDAYKSHEAKGRAQTP